MRNRAVASGNATSASFLDPRCSSGTGAPGHFLRQHRPHRLSARSCLQPMVNNREGGPITILEFGRHHANPTAGAGAAHEARGPGARVGIRVQNPESGIRGRNQGPGARRQDSNPESWARGLNRGPGSELRSPGAEPKNPGSTRAAVARGRIRTEASRS